VTLSKTSKYVRLAPLRQLPGEALLMVNTEVEVIEAGVEI
jgi:hypothetical protein